MGQRWGKDGAKMGQKMGQNYRKICEFRNHYIRLAQTNKVEVVLMRNLLPDIFLNTILFSIIFLIFYKILINSP